MIELFIHKPPMKSILRAIAKRYSIYLALDDINKQFGTDYTDADIVKWNHISEEDAIEELRKLNSEPNVQASVATESDSSNEAEKQNQTP